MKKRLIGYLKSINFQSETQFGFTENKSTEDALISFVCKIYESMNNNNKTSGVFIDFRKAFDLVDHRLLLGKMETCGVRGVALNWFQSFLIGRTQSVKIGDQFSPSEVVKAGVPQGSVLSANLFIIFINDLLKQNFSGYVSAFADDIALLYSNRKSSEICQNINNDFNILRSWCFENKMVLNVTKTKYINFDFKGFSFDRPIMYHRYDCNNLQPCDCKPVEKVSVFKYLGINLEEKMRWKNHTSFLFSQVRLSVRKFYFLRNICGVQLLRTLYYGLVHSRLQYGIVCYGGACKSTIDIIRKLQNKIVRIMLKQNRREPSFPLYQFLKVLPVQHLFVFKTLRLFYLRSGNRGSARLNYSTRSNEQRIFIKPKVNKSYFKQSFLYLGPQYFNCLPLKVKEINNVIQFCKELRNWLFTISDLSILNQTIT